MVASVSKSQTRSRAAGSLGALLLVFTIAGPGAAADASPSPGASPVPGASLDVQALLDSLDFGSGMATVVVGDESYDFTLSGNTTIGSTSYVGICQGFFGIVQAAGYATDGRDITVDMEVPPTDWETFTDGRYDAPRIEVEDNDGDAVWLADAGYADSGYVQSDYADQSGVTAFEKDGDYAKGSATFVDTLDASAEPVEGTFEVRCEES